MPSVRPSKVFTDIPSRDIGHPCCKESTIWYQIGDEVGFEGEHTVRFLMSLMTHV